MFGRPYFRSKKGQSVLLSSTSAKLTLAVGETFQPDPARAQALIQDIRHKLGTSLAELARACHGIIPLDEERLRCQSTALSSGLVIRPGAFLLYYDCLAAARSDDLDALAPLLHKMTTIPVEGPTFVVRNYGTTLAAEEWDRYRRALMTAPDTLVAVDAVPGALFEAASNLLATARDLLAIASPALAKEITILINEVVFVEDAAGMLSSFGGATSFQAWGVLFLNARRHPSLVSMTNGLVHEAAHMLLFALSSGEAMVQNDGGERYLSPLRADSRPMEGIFHATFVSARMCYAMDRLLALDALDPAERAEAIRARDVACCAFESGYAIVKEHARPTCIGQNAMNGAAAYMSISS
jgi:hypothetical protein